MLKALQLDCAHETERITRFIQKQLEGAGLSQLVLGISGGVDSALVAHLAVRAIGASNVWGMFLPYKTSSQESSDHANLVQDQLRMQWVHLDITGMVQPFVDHYPDINKQRLGNIMSRLRMVSLYDLSAAVAGLVAGTGNRTETLLGYFTLYGDGASALRPIGHLYKCQVRQLSEYLGIPDVIIRKPPSADLWSGQTDEDELGFGYDEADEVLFKFVERSMTEDEIVASGIARATVTKILGAMRATAFKRELPAVLPTANPAVDE